MLLARDAPENMIKMTEQKQVSDRVSNTLGVFSLSLLPQ